MENNKTLPRHLLIDGNSLAYRAFYALMRRPLFNSKGVNTTIAFGFIRMLIKAIQEFQPTNLCIMFDVSRKTFRSEIFPEYKMQRKPTPTDLLEQLPLLKDTITELGIKQIEMPGFEADDIIGSYCKLFGIDSEVIVVTGDKDLLQLITEKVEIIICKKGLSEFKRYNMNLFKEEYGVLEPVNITDLKGLMGDTSDNIPGVKGIGEKTAMKILSKYITIDELYKDLTDAPKKELLEKDRDMAFLSRQLATIKIDLEINISAEETLFNIMDFQSKGKVFSELEFYSMMEELNITPESKNLGEYTHNIIDNVDELISVLKKNKYEKNICIDTETQSVNPFDAELLGIGFAFKPEEVFYIHKSVSEPVQMDLFSTPVKETGDDWEKIVEYLQEACRDKCVIGHNIKYDLMVLVKYGLKLDSMDINDTMIASYLLWPDKRRHSLDRLALEMFSFEKISYKDLLKSTEGKKVHQDLTTVEVKKVAKYCSEDVFITFNLYNQFRKMLKDEDLMELYQDMELKLILPIIEMETNGIKIDKVFFKHLENDYHDILEDLKQKVFEIAGEEFNLDSPKQLSVILFEKMNIPPVKKIKTGYSTDSHVLEVLKADHEIAEQLLKYRTYAKLINTYIKPLQKLANSTTDRIHTSFNQTIAATGRLSSSNPNLQNIPVRDNEGAMIRKGFIAPYEFKLVSFDYSQIELRIFAHLSNSEVFIEAFKNNKDIHSLTAATLFETENVEKYMRRIAKTVNFGVLYGQTPFGLSRDLGISMFDAKNFIENYMEKYPAIRQYTESMIEYGKDKGYVRTISGRKRMVPELTSKNANIRKHGERVAVNTPVQGSAADIIKNAMIRVYDFLNDHPEYKTRMILQVHDELMFEMPLSSCDEIIPKIRSMMENVDYSLNVPLKVDVKEGPNWKEMTGI